MKAIGVMQLGTVVDLNAALALDAAHLGFTEGLTLADSVIYATARAYNATLWTQDAHFKRLPGVEYRERRAPAG